MKDIIEKLKKLEASATPGPWAKHPIAANVYQPEFECWIPHNAGDALFIAETRNAVPQLLDRLEKFEKLIDTIKWCDENDEPVSGYIIDALAALEKQ